MLALEVEWLMGTCVAATSPAEPSPEWPPQPDRVFSALVASWAARGARASERMALEWLEGLEPPRLEAVAARPRTTVTAYVPPNDARIGDIRILPDLRRRQPRQFPASVIQAESGTAHLRLLWEAEPDETQLGALQALARETSYVGHSSALVRCRFLIAPPQPSSPTHETLAAPHVGRLNELERLHVRHMSGDGNARPRPALLPQRNAAPAGQRARSIFGRRWIVFAHAGGERPDIRAAAAIGRAMRGTLMGAFPEAMPEWLSGHRPDGSPTPDPHLAIVPLANVGYHWSEGRLMGLGLILPRAREERWSAAATPQDFDERQAFERALAGLATGNGLNLTLGALGCWRIARQAGEVSSTLRPSRYGATSQSWSTVTPIALDQHPKGKDADRQAEAQAIIARACPRIGLPEPRSVLVHKHAAIDGAPSAWPPGGAPAWQGWARPGALAGRPLFHATLHFAEPVEGPVILGAGRFFGLGLCLPVAGATL